MKKTYHYEVRKNNRGISDFLVDLVLEYGDTVGDKIILGKKKTEVLIADIKRLEKGIKKICDKNGLAVVIEDDSFITTYPLHKKINRIKTINEERR